MYRLYYSIKTDVPYYFFEKFPSKVTLSKKFEDEVYKLISEIVNNNEFMVSNPNVRIRRKPRYYSKDREAEIEFDVSVEKYLCNPDENEKVRPSIIVVIECKDYSKSIPVDDVEEFHAKLQQIGADNTKGMMITQNGCFQRSSLAYAESKGIALARILSTNQIHFVSFYRINPRVLEIKMTEEEKRDMIERRIRPLIDKDFISYNKDFFSSTGDYYLEKLIFRLLGIDDWEDLSDDWQRLSDDWEDLSDDWQHLIIVE